MNGHQQWSSGRRDAMVGIAGLGCSPSDGRARQEVREDRYSPAVVTAFSIKDHERTISGFVDHGGFLHHILLSFGGLGFVFLLIIL